MTSLQPDDSHQTLILWSFGFNKKWTTTHSRPTGTMLHFYCSVSDTDFFFFLFFSSLYLVFFVVNTKPDKRLTHNKHASFLPLECIVSTQSISAVEQGSTDHLKNQTNKQKYFWGSGGCKQGQRLKSEQSVGTPKRCLRLSVPLFCRSFLILFKNHSWWRELPSPLRPPSQHPVSRVALIHITKLDYCMQYKSFITPL